MLQADDEDDMMEQQMKSPFGSSFRTFDATDYKPIGTTFYWVSLFCFVLNPITANVSYVIDDCLSPPCEQCYNLFPDKP